MAGAKRYIMYMKRYIIIYSLALVSLAVFVPPYDACAQKIPFSQAAKTAFGKSALTDRALQGTAVSAAAHQAALSRNLPAVITRANAASLATHQAQVLQAKDMRQSVAKVLSSFLEDWPEKQQPSATAFVFKTHYNGKEEVWGATAAHIAKGMGNRLSLVFYNGSKRIDVPAEVVQYGPNMVSDIALLKLPDQLPPDIEPLPLAAKPAPLYDVFISGGYSAHKFVYTGKQQLQKDNSRFMRTDYAVPLKSRPGLCGAPLINTQGEVAGVHCGSVWGRHITYAANVQLLQYLLKAQHEGTADIPLVAGKVVLGDIKTTEHIHSVEALNARGQTVERYDTGNELTQSTIVSLLQLPETRFVRIMLEDRKNKPTEFNMRNKFRYLIYDKEEKTSFYQDIQW